MQVLKELPPYTGEWFSLLAGGLPPMETAVLAAGSVQMSDGSWQRKTEKAYWRCYDEEDGPEWYIAGPDGFKLQQVTHFMPLPPLPENCGSRAYTHQYTAQTCPGKPCSEGCNHRGRPHETQAYIIVSASEKGFWSDEASEGFED